MASKLPATNNRPDTRLSEPWDRAFGFPLFHRLSHELDELFDRFGLERPHFDSESDASWMPAIELSTKDNQLVITADVPGMKKEDLTVEVGDDHLVLRGERKQETKEKKDGFFRTERTYGSFCRTVPLPDGAKPELVKAVMRDGVLEISMPMMKAESTTRTIEIGEPTPGQQPKAA